MILVKLTKFTPNDWPLPSSPPSSSTTTQNPTVLCLGCSHNICPRCLPTHMYTSQIVISSCLELFIYIVTKFIFSDFIVQPLSFPPFNPSPINWDLQLAIRGSTKQFSNEIGDIEGY